MMNFQFYLEKLHSSDEFKNFIRENPKSFFCSAFISIDKEGRDNKTHIDFFNPKEKEIFSFQLENGVNVTKLENSNNDVPEKIPEDIDFNFSEIEEIIEGKMKEENLKNKIQKILLSMQNFSDKSIYLIGTIFISGMGLLKTRILIPEGKITGFEKKSFLDMIKIIKKNDQ